MDLEAKSKQPGGSSTAFDNGAELCAWISEPGLKPRPGAYRFIAGVTDSKPIACIGPCTAKFVQRLHAAPPATVGRPFAGAAHAREKRKRKLQAGRGHILRRAGDIISERNHELPVPNQLLERACGSVTERNGAAFRKMHPESAPDNFCTANLVPEPGQCLSIQQKENS